MGFMNKLRDNTGIILWILVIAFGLIWTLQDSGGLDAIGTTTGRNIIVVDGDPIDYDVYQRAVNQQAQSYTSQTGESMQPQQMDAAREQVFDALVDDRLREREMDRLGITVTDEEVEEMILGADPHPIVAMYFGDGQSVDRARLQNVIDNLGDDPELLEQWLQLEDYLRTVRRREKLEGLLDATIRVSEQDVLDEYDRRNRTADAEYVALRYADVPDDSIQVGEGDYRAFYDEHRDLFAREQAYTVQYVLTSKAPTAGDTTLIVNELERVRERFAEAADDSLFLVRSGSERGYTSAYFRPDELGEDLAAAVFESPEPGQILGPIFADGAAHLVKIKDVREAEEPVVRARHILIRAPEDDEDARALAREAIDDAKDRIEAGEPFEALAREVSDDGSAARGGDLGWFGRDAMVEPFAEAAFGAEPGALVGPVETEYGVHLIEVVDRADTEVQLADYATEIRTDVSTLSKIEERLNDLQYYAEESGAFAEEAERLGLPVQTMQIEADQEAIPGIGFSRTITNFLDGAEPGDVSDVIELDEGFIVLHVTDVQEEGYRPFSEVQGEIEPRVRLEKKGEVARRRLERALAAGGFDGLAAAVGVPQREATGLTFESAVVPGLGREPAFIGTVFGLGEGATSDVVAGENAAFVVRVTNMNEPAPITEAEREQIRTALLNQRQSALRQQWIAELRDRADIVDNRAQLERQ